MLVEERMKQIALAKLSAFHDIDATLSRDEVGLPVYILKIDEHYSRIYPNTKLLTIEGLETAVDRAISAFRMEAFN